MPAAKPLTKQQIEKAMKHTKSNRAAAKYLGCSYNTYKLYSKMFIDEKSGLTLFDKHLNRSGKGIPKWGNNGRDIPIDEILNGTAPRHSYDAQKLKDVLIREQKLLHQCGKCGYDEERILDFKKPLLLNYKNGNDKDWTLDNLELLCYNCYFINVGDVFTPKQIKGIEDNYTPQSTNKTDWEVEDTSWEEQLPEDEEIELWDNTLNDGLEDGRENQYISYL